MSGEVAQIISPVSYSFPVNGLNGAFGAWTELGVTDFSINEIELFPAAGEGNILVNVGVGTTPSSITIPNFFVDIQGGPPVRFPLHAPAGATISVQGVQYSGTTGSEIGAAFIFNPNSVGRPSVVTSYGQGVGNGYYGYQPAGSTSWQQMGNQITGAPIKKLIVTYGDGNTNVFNTFQFGYGLTATSVTPLRTILIGNTQGWALNVIYLDAFIPAGQYLWLNNNDNANIVTGVYGIQ